jgi:hypothetical protein
MSGPDWIDEVMRLSILNSERNRSGKFRMDFFGRETTVPAGMFISGEFGGSVTKRTEAFLKECFDSGLSPEETMGKASQLPLTPWMF